MKILLKLYANLNLGDDLFLRILLERYPDVKFYLPGPEEYKSLFSMYDNLEIVNDVYGLKLNVLKRTINYVERKFFLESYINKLEKRYSKVFNLNESKFDAFISIGGSIFMQKKIFPVYNNIVYYNMAQKYCGKTYFLGCNFGPFTDPLFLQDYKTIFSKAADVCFREKASWMLFSELSNVRYRPDIVFGLNYSKIAKRNKSIGFSIVGPRNNMDSEAYIKKHVELIELYQRENYEVFLFSYCEAQGDGAIIDLIIDSLGDKDLVNKIIYNGDIDGFLNIYASMEQMYCGRFHSMILSMIFNQKIFPVVYSKKMVNVLNDINYKGDTVNIEDFYKADVNHLFTQINHNFYNVQNCIINSSEQFEELDLFIIEKR